MAVLFTEPCNGTDSADVTTENTNFASVLGTGTSVFTNAQSVEGGSSIFATATRQLEGTFALGSSFYTSAYVRLSQVSIDNQTIGHLRDATTQRADIQLRTNGVIGVRDAFTLVGSTVGPLPANEWIRLEWTVDAGTQTLNVFYGADLNGDTPTDSATGAITNSSSNNFRIGPMSAGQDIWFARTIVDDSTMAAPVAPGVLVTGSLTATGALNLLAGTSGRSLVGAANALAGTTGLTLAGALNAHAGTSGLTSIGAANAAAGTTGLTLAGACNALTGS